MAIGQPYEHEIELNERYDGAEEKEDDGHDDADEDGDGGA